MFLLGERLGRGKGLGSFCSWGGDKGGVGQLLQLLATFLASAAGEVMREGLGSSAAGGGVGETLVTVFRREVNTSLYFSAFFGISCFDSSSDMAW